MKNLKKIFSVLLVLVLMLALVPFASAEEIGNVTIRVYPNSSYATNQNPIVGMEASKIQVKPSCNVTVTSFYVTDPAGNQITGKLEYKNYQLHITAVANAGDVISPSASASVNNEFANISVDSTGVADIVWSFLAAPIAPTIYHSPTDERHEIGGTFSFTATCSDPDAKPKWYIYDQVNNRNTVAELTGKYDNMQLIETVTENGTARLNIHNAVEGIDGWSVACSFTNDAGTVWTERAYCRVTNSTLPTNPVVDPAASPVSDPKQSSDMPDGVYLVDPPTPEVYVVETPEPTPEATVVGTTAAVDETEAKTGEKPFSRVLKWIVIGIAAIVIIVGAVILIQYLKDKKRRERRAKMAAAKNSANYRGKH